MSEDTIAGAGDDATFPDGPAPEEGSGNAFVTLTDRPEALMTMLIRAGVVDHETPVVDRLSATEDDVRDRVVIADGPVRMSVVLAAAAVWEIEWLDGLPATESATAEELRRCYGGFRKWRVVRLPDDGVLATRIVASAPEVIEQIRASGLVAHYAVECGRDVEPRHLRGRVVISDLMSLTAASHADRVLVVDGERSLGQVRLRRVDHD
jgi:hypothetical protein